MRKSRIGCEVCLIILAVLFVGAGVLAFGLVAIPLGVDSLRVRADERRYRAGTAAAYAGTAELDLKLARQRIASDDLEGGESRLARAEDKMNSHRAVGVETIAARTELGELQGRYAQQLKPVRRKRVMDRLARDGAEIR